MSIITRIRTLTLTAFAAAIAVAPGCDDGAKYEALGVTDQDLEAMSAEELDALDAAVEAGELVDPVVLTHAEALRRDKGLTIRPRPTHGGEAPAPAADGFAAEPDEPTGCDTHGDVVEFAAE